MVDLIYELERLVDGSTLSAVLEALSGVCHAKAAHVRENWQDGALARAWTRAGVELEKTALRRIFTEV